MTLVVFSLLAGLGLREPSPPDEPRFVLAARAMVESGQWLLPHRGIELYAEKPPVFMWMQAAAHALTGEWRIAFLLPSLLAALLTLWLSYDLARRLWNRRVARYAVLALFACVQFGLMAKRAQIDMVLVALTTLSLCCLLRHLLHGPDWTGWGIAAFAAGLGTVTKGVGFLPLLVLLPWALWRRPLPARAGDRWRWMSMLPLFLAGAGVWLLPLLLALWHSPDPAVQAYAHELLFKQTGTRYAAAWHHRQPPWYYLQVMATLWLPGVLLLPWLLPAWWRRCRRGDARYRLLLGWSVLVLLFFSASPGKREVYIFPMLPALCVAAAPLLGGLLRRRAVRALLFGYLLAIGVAATVLGACALHGSGWILRDAMRRAIDPAAIRTLGCWLLALGIGTVLIAAWARPRRAGAAVVVASALLWGIYGLGLMPTLDPYSSASRLMRQVGARIGPHAELGLLAWREQNMLQADRPVTDFGFKAPWREQWRQAGPWLEAAPRQRWLLVLDRALSPCIDPAQVVQIGQANRNRWLLVPGWAWKSGCAATAATADSADDGDNED